MDEQQAIQRARTYFLSETNIYGCAETTFMTLKEAFGLPQPQDSAVAMVLNGGVAYYGGVCGAISGAAMAVGLLAERRLADHIQAKRTARRIIASYIDAFDMQHASINCRDLLGLDIREEAQHHQFIESGIWRERCMRQIEFAIEKLAALQDERTWWQVVEQFNPQALNYRKKYSE